MGYQPNFVVGLDVQAEAWTYLRGKSKGKCREADSSGILWR